MNLTRIADRIGSYLPPDIGVVHYVVDHDYRTQAQGWSRADKTGPLDLYLENANNPVGGYVFRTGDNNWTDSQAIQKAIDTAIDNRGDTIVLTPGAYSLATALVADCADLRIMGPYCSAPERARTTVTAAVAASIGITAAAKRMEIGYLRLVPLTASHMIAVADGANFQHWHDFYYDADGITANTATQLCLIDGAMNHSVIEKFVYHTDGAQGPLIETDGTIENVAIQYWRHYHNAGTLAIALLDVDGAATSSIYTGHGRGIISGGGAVTAMITLADQTANTVCGMTEDFIGCVGYCAANALVTVAGTAAEWNIVTSGLALADASAAAAVDGESTAIQLPVLRITPYSS